MAADSLISSPGAGAGRQADLPLQVDRLRFVWPSGQVALDGCSFAIPRPGLWMRVGGNGSGKSTLLRLIAGLLEPSSGQLLCNRKPALVFQNPDHQLLLPSCGSDVQLSLPPGLSAPQRQGQIALALEQVGLGGLQQRPIHSLSGGQKQRLAVAGALASRAQLLLLDEPTALLDQASQRDVLALVRQLCNPAARPAPGTPEGAGPGAITALWITHRLDELDQCDGAALVRHGRVGRWQDGSALRQRLNRLPLGRGER